MSKLFYRVMLSLTLGFTLVLTGCVPNSFKSSGSSKKNTTTKKDENLMNEILKLSDSEIEKLLEDTNQDGKEVSVCMYYKQSSSSGSSDSWGGGWSKDHHNCDQAIFNVIFNGKTLSDKLNINNRTQRTVTGISGKEYTVGGNNNYGGSSDGGPVPGQVFKGSWKNNKFVINTTCGLSGSGSYGWGGGGCHEGIASYSLIGKVTLDYKGQSVDMYLTASETTIDTGKEYTYKLADFKLEKTEYSFGDYCELDN